MRKIEITISCDKLPDQEVMRQLGKMLEEGYKEGIDMPAGLNWWIEEKGKRSG